MVYLQVHFGIILFANPLVIVPFVRLSDVFLSHGIVHGVAHTLCFAPRCWWLGGETTSLCWASEKTIGTVACLRCRDRLL